MRESEYLVVRRRGYLQINRRGSGEMLTDADRDFVREAIEWYERLKEAQRRAARRRARQTPRILISESGRVRARAYGPTASYDDPEGADLT